MPISSHFRYCKVLLFLSLTHVSSTMASVQTFNLFLTQQLWYRDKSTVFDLVVLKTQCFNIPHQHPIQVNGRKWSYVKIPVSIANCCAGPSFMFTMHFSLILFLYIHVNYNFDIQLMKTDNLASISALKLTWIQWSQLPITASKW